MPDKNETDEKLQDLLTVVVDARNGYREAVEDANRASMREFFSGMVALKDRHVTELEGLLRARGVEPDESGSFLTTVNKAIFSIRSIFNGLDEGVLPGLIDGESRIVGYYDEAIPATDREEREALARQRLELVQTIDTMKAMQQPS